MGIYDRDYIRREPPPRAAPSPGAALGGMRMWSVNTWLIVICVAVFAVDALMPAAVWRPVVVMRDVPAYVDLVGGARYVEIRDENAELRAKRHRGVFTRVVYDTKDQRAVGKTVYSWMPPLQRWFHFSTDTAFRRLEVWRFVGFQFLHANLMHLLFNMIALYFFGPVIEQYLGRKRYLAFYLLCGICGALMYLLLNLGGFLATWANGGDPVDVPLLLVNSTATPLVGASAGVFGVLMAGAYKMPNAMVLLFFFLPMRLATLAYALVAVSLLTLIFGGVNAGGEAGHLGGAIAGFYFIRHPQHLHGFFDIVGWVDPTSHHYQHRRTTGRRSEIDRILDKIQDQGLNSLSEREKRVLREASRRD